MNKHVVTLIKFLFVGGMMWFVFTLIDFEDRLVFRQGEEVVQEEVIEIVGDWRRDPVRFVRDGVEQQAAASRELEDGRRVD
ncbi:MAG: hypothetical protein KAI24_00400, partial [Planctomycetes bacterium]|nr:hypothetical protein [Planctomycetota bacterium]